MTKLKLSPLFGLGFCLAFVIPPAIEAIDIERGNALHREHCLRCHQEDIYTRPERFISDLEQLRERVKQCELANELLWFDEDVDDVTAWLNSRYYQFGIK